MKALVKYDAAPGNMEIRDVPEPSAGPGQIKIQVKVAGICGSDLHIYHSDIAIPVNPPVTTGHEFSGVIAEVGEGVEGFRVGDRVVSETAYSFCGTCDFCTEGYYNLCSERKTLGYWYNGIFTNYTVVPAARVHKIPEGVSDLTAAMTEPLACVCHAVYDLNRIKGGDVVLVIGPGAIGNMAMQVAKAQGAVVIISGTDIDQERLKLAKKLGADYAVNIQKENLEELVMKITGGYGVDCVLECSGSAPGTNTGLNLIKKLGYFTQVGMGRPNIDFQIEKVIYKELHFRGSLGSRKRSWRTALRLMEQGKVNLEPLAGTVLPLERWQEAFDRFEKKDGNKFMLLPCEED